MDDRLLKPGEVDVMFRYPTGRTMRLVRQGRIPSVRLPDGEIRIQESYVKTLTEGATWRPTAELIRSRQHLASESAINGLIAYCYGGCEQSLIGDAISAAYTTPEEANRAIYAELEGRELTDDAIDLIVLHHYILLGIFRGIQAKTSGQLKGAKHAES